MKKKYKTLTSNQKCGKHHSVEEMAKDILAAQNKKQKKNKRKKNKRTEQYDDDDSAGMEYIQDMLDNF